MSLRAKKNPERQIRTFFLKANTFKPCRNLNLNLLFTKRMSHSILNYTVFNTGFCRSGCTRKKHAHPLFTESLYVEFVKIYILCTILFLRLIYFFLFSNILMDICKSIYYLIYIYLFKVVKTNSE